MKKLRPFYEKMMKAKEAKEAKGTKKTMKKEKEVIPVAKAVVKKAKRIEVTAPTLLDKDAVNMVESAIKNIREQSQKD